MKPAICLASAVFTLVLLLANSTTVPAEDLTGLGYLDVTSLGADPTGAKDSTAAIQQGVEAAREGEYVLFFPAGTYTVSDTIQCLFEIKIKARRLQGSTNVAGHRAVIRLAPNSAGFGDPKRPKVVLHFRRPDEGNADHYEQSIMTGFFASRMSRTSCLVVSRPKLARRAVAGSATNRHTTAGTAVRTARIVRWSTFTTARMQPSWTSCPLPSSRYGETRLGSDRTRHNELPM